MWFIFVQVFSFAIRINSVFFVTFVNILFSVLLLYASNVVAKKDTQIVSLVFGPMGQTAWSTAFYMFLLLMWIIYSYKEELNRKLRFVTHLRRGKEFQKQKQIFNILIPSLVRDRI